MKEIVVGVAVDKPTLVPWRFAMDVAAGSKARLRAVMINNAINVSALPFASGDVIAELEDRTRTLWGEGAKSIESRIREEALGRGLELRFTLGEGTVVERLLEFGQDAYLVVIGRGRNSVTANGQMGNNAELLARRCQQALLITPDSYLRPNRVVAAYGGKGQGERVLRMAIDLSNALRVGLIILTVAGGREELRSIQERARETLSGIETDAEYVGVVGEPREMIPDYSSERDILVVGPHGHSPVYRMLFGSVADHVIRAAQGPVVVPARL